mmetsp:Transcript_28901/g.65365  ORF Transcript_28901/g.65365 Transcript_28901/m.65365 type:complete len:285 (-) Transcript_28901:704-1558(-)
MPALGFQNVSPHRCHFQGSELDERGHHVTGGLHCFRAKPLHLFPLLLLVGDVSKQILLAHRFEHKVREGLVVILELPLSDETELHPNPESCLDLIPRDLDAKVCLRLEDAEEPQLRRQLIIGFVVLGLYLLPHPLKVLPYKVDGIVDFSPALDSTSALVVRVTDNLGQPSAMPDVAELWRGDAENAEVHRSDAPGGNRVELQELALEAGDVEANGRIRPPVCVVMPSAQGTVVGLFGVVDVARKICQVDRDVVQHFVVALCQQSLLVAVRQLEDSQQLPCQCRY